MSYQSDAKKEHFIRGYTKDPRTLALVLCEEAGEVAKAVNFYHNPEYKPTPGRPTPDNLKHELIDCLVAISMLALIFDIDLGI
jgi:NTP pyrophosphatase (non-canonical NTP hydrolase)